MKTTKSIVLGLFSIVLLASCGKSNYSDILYYRNTPKAVNQSAAIKEISSSGKVDMIWIIDNSASMDTYQNTVINNSAAFMKDFIAQGLDWKLGLLSTDDDYSSRNPYSSFAGSTPLDSTVADPASVFSQVVGQLGTSGSGTEKTFDPILTALNKDKNFLRSNTPLVFILVTDAPEQSKIGAPEFISRLRAIIGDREMYVYTVLAAIETGCYTEEEHFQYKGSPYEAWANNATASATFSICKDFGKNLAALGQEIVTRVSHPTIYLDKRPQISTLQVVYKGVVLPAGSAASGGYWRYDATINAIVFNSLDFSAQDADSVQINFTEDLPI